jgi:hypothetical protein
VDHVRHITDRAAARDWVEVNRVCEHCQSPELFCACSDEVKRVLEGWDLPDPDEEPTPLYG